MKGKICEGTWFAVPLREGGFATAVIARSSARGGVLLAYFFGKIWQELPQLNELKALESPSSAVRILRVGDLGLIEGKWPILGRDPEWRRGDWPVPLFVRKEELSRRAWIVHYSDEDPNVVKSETPTNYDADLERDRLSGAGAVEIVLTNLLSKGDKT